MHAPALFRWLSKKYPKIISPVIEDQPTNVDGQEVPVDATKANPNGEEFDNLYLDMNGIVHPCSHPEDRPPPANEEEMMLAVFNYTDRVVNMVRPRKLLLIAVGMFDAKKNPRFLGYDSPLGGCTFPVMLHVVKGVHQCLQTGMTYPHTNIYLQMVLRLEQR